MKQKFYQKTWFILLFLLILPPIGISLLWLNKKFKKNIRIGLTIFSAFIFLIFITPTDDNSSNNENRITSEQKTTDSNETEIDKRSTNEDKKEVLVSNEANTENPNTDTEPLLNNVEAIDNSEKVELDKKVGQIVDSDKVELEKHDEQIDKSGFIEFKGIAYKIIEVDGGDLSGKRIPNVAVDIGYGDREYWAFTNDYGQLVYVIADEIVLQDDNNEPVLSSGRYYKDEAKVKGTELKNYDEGHVIADSLGGVSNAYNITPQDSILNRHGNQAYMEKVIRDVGGCKDFIATITYPDTKTQIPSHYKYEYILKGEYTVDEFDNINPDDANASLNTETPNSFNEQKELKKIDKNNNGKVTIAEAKAAGYFMPIYSDHWLYKYMDDRDKDGLVGE